MGGSSKGSGVGEVDGWRKAGRLLRARGQMTLALGEVLEEGLADGPDALVARLQAILSGVPVEHGLGREPVVARGAKTRVQVVTEAGSKDDHATGTALRVLQGSDLTGRPWPVVWFTSAGAGAERATVALGVREDGSKRVVGLWGGSSGEQRVGQNAAMDLWVRGLNRGMAWLAVTGCERALGQALKQRWGERLALAHCKCDAGAAVLSHLPTDARGLAERTLRSAWDTPDVVAGRAALERLADSWREAYPGASARLRQEIEPTTAVEALGVHGALALRLRTAVSAKHLLTQALPAARGRSGRAWLGCVAAELLRRQAAFRRLPEHAELEALVRCLRQRDAEAVAG